MVGGKGFVRYYLWIAAWVVFQMAMGAGSSVAREKDIARYEWLICKIAVQERIDPVLLHAVVATESNFDPFAFSHKGAVGLMQIIPSTADVLKVSNLFNPEDNLRGGARYLKQMHGHFADLRLALAAYNAGPAAVERHAGIPPFKETLEYVERVLRHYRSVKKQRTLCHHLPRILLVSPPPR